jgi:hypothetical protein
MEATARERRKELDTKEYESMIDVIKGGDEFTLDDFLALVKRLRTPFRTKVDETVVTVSEDDCAIMMKTSALEAIATTVLVKKRATVDSENGNLPANKRQRTGRAACDTTFGANAIQAQHGSQRRDDNQNEKMATKQINALKRELCNNKETLTLLERRKEKIKHKIENRNRTEALRLVSVRGQNYEPLVVGAAANESRTLLEERVSPVLTAVGTHRMVSENGPVLTHVGTHMMVSENGPVLTPVGTHRMVSESSDQSDSTVTSADRVHPVLPAVELYWEVSKASDQSDLILMLRLFAPACGKLSKSKADQFAFIESRNLNQLSQARVDSKVEEIRQRIPEIQATLLGMVDDNVASGND